MFSGSSLSGCSLLLSHWVHSFKDIALSHSCQIKTEHTSSFDLVLSMSVAPLMLHNIVPSEH